MTRNPNLMDARLIEYENARHFLSAIEDRVVGREVELNLMLGLATRGYTGLYATLDDDTGPLAAVVRVPPHEFVAAELVEGSILDLASALLERSLHLDSPSVVGTTPISRIFAERWIQQVGGSTHLEMAQRILALTNVVESRAPVPGTFRLATDNDADLIELWFRAFAEDTFSRREAAAGGWAAAARERVRLEQVFVWETEGRLVSMACLARPTGVGVAITGVFTPREERGRGFASACVGALSQRALANGYRFCCLYTNAANPTSNRIYERIGYRLVAESELWAFERTSTEG